MTRPALIAAALASLLAGCETTSQNAVIGGVVGAGSGAALGTLAGGDDRRNALVGAGIGLLAGSMIGGYLDAQERDLRSSLYGTGATVENRGDRLVVIFPGNVTFDTNSATINPGFYGPLQNVAATLQQYPESFLDVIGHTDSTGSAEHNQRLSEERAESVAGFFRGQGVYPGRIATFGLGQSQPVATNATAEGRAQNRRVELIIIPAQA